MATDVQEISVRIKFLVHFRKLFGGKEREVHLSRGSNVLYLLNVVCDTPGLRHELLSGSELKSQVVILKNGIPIQSMQGLETELADGDTIAIFPFLAGG